MVLILAGPMPDTRFRRSSASRKRPPVSRASMIRCAVRGPIPFTCSSSAALAVLTSTRSGPDGACSTGGKGDSAGRRSPRGGEPPASHSVTRAGSARSAAPIRMSESARWMNAAKGRFAAVSWFIAWSSGYEESEQEGPARSTCRPNPALRRGLLRPRPEWPRVIRQPQRLRSARRAKATPRSDSVMHGRPKPPGMVTLFVGPDHWALGRSGRASDSVERPCRVWTVTIESGPMLDLSLTGLTHPLAPSAGVFRDE